MTTESLNRIQVPPNHSVFTAKLIDLLKERGAVGATITDEESSRVAGRNTSPTGAGYPSLASAIKYVRKNHRIVWARVRGAMAIKCLDANEIAEVAEGASAHVRRVSKRTLEKLHCVEMEQVDEKERPRVLALVAQHGTLAQFASTNTRKAMVARNVDQPLDFTSTMKLLNGSK